MYVLVTGMKSVFIECCSVYQAGREAVVLVLPALLQRRVGQSQKKSIPIRKQPKKLLQHNKTTQIT